MIPLYDDQPTRTKPVLTIALIVINVLVFVWQSSAGGEIENQVRLFRYAAVPYNITQKNDVAVLVVYETPAGRPEIDFTERSRAADVRTIADGRGRGAVIGAKTLEAEQAVSAWITLFTSMFMHGGWMHLLGNMWFLWIFGNNIEDALGRARFFVFYLLTGLAAHAAHIASAPMSLIPTIGASGAISGILGGYVLLYPRAKVMTLVPMFGFMRMMALPAVAFLGLWFVMQLTGVLGQSAGGGGGVAWWAHIGGFIVGFIFVKLFESHDHEAWRTTGNHAFDGVGHAGQGFGGQGRAYDPWTGGARGPERRPSSTFHGDDDPFRHR